MKKLQMPLTCTYDETESVYQFDSIISVTNNAQEAINVFLQNQQEKLFLYKYSLDNWNNWIPDPNGVSPTIACTSTESQVNSQAADIIENKIKSQPPEKSIQTSDEVCNISEQCLGAFDVTKYQVVCVNKTKPNNPNNNTTEEKEISETCNFKINLSYSLGGQPWSKQAPSSAMLSCSISAKYKTIKFIESINNMKQNGHAQLFCSSCGLVDSQSDCPNQSRYKFCETDGCPGLGCFECY